MIHIHTVFRRGVLLFVLLLLAACSSGPDIRSDFDRSVDFGAYDSYGFVRELGTDRAEYSSLITNYFKESIRAEMEARGYRYDENAPDLLVNFYTSVRERTDVVSRPSPVFGAGYYSYRYGLYTAWPAYGYGYTTQVDTYQYKVGTVNIDVVDAGRRQLIWEGVAEGRLKDKALAAPREPIRRVVGEIFQRYPLPSARAAGN
jgi:hypothetical protein